MKRIARYGETSSTVAFIFPRSIGREEALAAALDTGDIVAGDYYGGPGRRFYFAPVVRERGSRIIVSQFGGLDI